MFRAFFDESGTDRRKNKAFVIGGFLGRIEEWLKASDAWEESLHKHPRIEYFKHSEYQSLGGQFVRFNRQQAENKIVSLASTIANVDLHGFCSIAPHRIIESKPVEKGLLGSRIYDWAFGGVIKLVLEHMQAQPLDEKVDFVFDARNELRANIENFNRMKGQTIFAELMSHAGECSIGDDHQIVALQMADLLAAEFLKAGEQQIQSDAFKIIRDKNTIAYTRDTPPAQHLPMLALMSLGAQVQQEAGQFLKANRQKLMCPEETLNRLLELKIMEASFNEQQERLFSFLENDPEYQNFRRQFIASTGIDPMNPPER